jgi:ketosteroid isomerase-like protein
VSNVTRSDKVDRVGNIELAQRYFVAWNSRDVATLRELTDPEVTFVFPQETAGLDDVLGWIENADSEEPEHLDVSFVDRELTEDEATVVSTVKRVYTWKETGEHANSMRVRSTLTFRDDRITKVEVDPPEQLPDE